MLTADELTGIVRLLRQARGELTVTVEGCSMEPLFHGGTALRVACGSGSDRSPGSLVLFVGDRAQLVVHRVITAGQNGQYLITKGDNNLSIDRPVLVGSVLGVITGPANPSQSLKWAEHRPALGALSRRLDIAAARRSFRAAWLIASVTVFTESVGRTLLRRFRNVVARRKGGTVQR